MACRSDDALLSSGWILARHATLRPRSSPEHQGLWRLMSQGVFHIASASALEGIAAFADLLLIMRWSLHWGASAGHRASAGRPRGRWRGWGRHGRSIHLFSSSRRSTPFYGGASAFGHSRIHLAAVSSRRSVLARRWLQNGQVVYREEGSPSGRDDGGRPTYWPRRPLIVRLGPARCVSGGVVWKICLTWRGGRTPAKRWKASTVSPVGIIVVAVRTAFTDGR